MTKRKLKKFAKANVRFAKIKANGYKVKNCDGRIYVLQNENVITDFWGDDKKGLKKLFEIVLNK